jgi:hypothetical protein
MAQLLSDPKLALTRSSIWLGSSKSSLSAMSFPDHAQFYGRAGRTSVRKKPPDGL